MERITLADYFASANKELLNQWDKEKNGALTPADVTTGSRKKVWWRCEKGHTWLTEVRLTVNGSGCPVCANRVILPGVNDLATTNPELAAQWDDDKNTGLSPTQVSSGSRKKVWWKCPHGHSWRAAVFSRSEGTGCPICAGRAVEKGFNDLATTHPALAEQWDQSKNGDLTPRDVVSGTKRKVWWRCKEGHSWQASVASRANGADCPYCTGKIVIEGKNDLFSLMPELAEQWDYDKNEGIRPENVSMYSNRRVWWKCPLGHSWRAPVSSRADLKGCPYCTGRRLLKGFNDLATVYPKIAAQWHPTLNGELKPDMVMPGTLRSAWWQCGEGHVWKARIGSRTGPKKHGCPVCAGNTRRRKRYDELLAESKIK